MSKFVSSGVTALLSAFLIVVLPGAACAERRFAYQSAQPDLGDARAMAQVARQQQAGLTLTPWPVSPPVDVQPAPPTPEQICKRDEEKLARLRVSQVRDEVSRFERELGCERLRPQVIRLRESISGQEDHSGRADVQWPPTEQQRPNVNAQPQRSERDVSVDVPPSVSQDQICKRDQERLAKLRASQAHDEVVRFERELGCERLRPQVVRLRESLAN